MIKAYCDGMFLFEIQIPNLGKKHYLVARQLNFNGENKNCIPKKNKN